MKRRHVLALAALAGVCTFAPTAATAPRPLEASLKRIDAGLARLSRNAEFTGTVLVAKDGRPVLQRAYGLADRATGRRNRITTRFNLASASKMWTGVAVAQLVQAGRVRFDDPVGRHVGGLPAPLSRVTIAQLLTHTGGTGDFFTHPEYPRRQRTLTSLHAYLPLIVDVPLEGTAGRRFRYSNSGYILLGLVVEAASGTDYYTYVRRNVLGRAGMTRSGCFGKRERRADVAVGYVSGGAANTATLPPRGSSAGGCYASAPNLLRFARALFAHRLLSARLTRIVTSAKVPDGFGGAYGYGFAIRYGRRGDSPSVWHNGGAPGVGSEVVMNQGLGYVVVILSNTGAAGVEGAADLVLNELRIP